jgi:hypothetical protein
MNITVNEQVAALRPGHAKPAGEPFLISPQARDLLNLARLQARLTVAQTAKCLNVGEEDIACLVSAGLLTPLGHPRPNAVKWFAAMTVLELAGDVEALGKMTDAIYEYWRNKNAHRNMATANGLDRNGHG